MEAGRRQRREGVYADVSREKRFEGINKPKCVIIERVCTCFSETESFTDWMAQL